MKHATFFPTPFNNSYCSHEQAFIVCAQSAMMWHTLSYTPSDKPNGQKMSQNCPKIALPDENYPKNGGCHTSMPQLTKPKFWTADHTSQVVTD
jgi:hypothetical protein